MARNNRVKTKESQLSIRINGELKEKARSKAKSEHRTLAAIISDFLNIYIGNKSK